MVGDVGMWRLMNNSCKLQILVVKSWNMTMIINLSSFFFFLGPDCRPLVVFINRKSGGQQGAELIAKFQELLDPHQVISYFLIVVVVAECCLVWQVFDLSEGGPKNGLLSFLNVPNHVVCFSTF